MIVSVRFIPFRGKLSFPYLDLIVGTVHTRGIIVASEKYEFNKQDKEFEFSHISYWIHIRDKSFLPSAGGPDS